ncbi:MAG TPA: hypothetical protein VNC22_12195, partial [Sporichthya sp.]|nr:hypothetical protein [Sporichthya sp.]
MVSQAGSAVPTGGAFMASIETAIPAQGLVRDLRAEELDAYERDGAAIVRGVLPLAWVDALSDAVDGLMAAEDLPAVDFAAGEGPRFFSMIHASMFDPVIRAWAVEGPLVDLARQVLPHATRLNFYF